MDFRKVDNWKSGWRKLVEWDKINKVYLYKGYEIIPLSYKEQYEMPLHLQNEYYWAEISLIEDRIELEKKYAEQSKFPRKTADEELDEIWELLEWN